MVGYGPFDNAIIRQQLGGMQPIGQIPTGWAPPQVVGPLQPQSFARPGVVQANRGMRSRDPRFQNRMLKRQYKDMLRSDQPFAVPQSPQWTQFVQKMQMKPKWQNALLKHGISPDTPF